MTTADLLERAHWKLAAIRDQITDVRAKPWHASGTWHLRCLELLQEITGLEVDFDRTGCEVAYKAIEEDRTDFAWVSRDLRNEADRLVQRVAYWEEEEASDQLVQFYLDNLPPPQTEDIFHILGMYFPEHRVISGRAEVYWARIAAFCRKSPNLAPFLVSKVVMIHELAHYVTHQGVDGGAERGVHWKDFSTRGEDIVEIVAQVATEEVIEALYERELTQTFEEMLKTQSARYTEHRKIRQAVWNAYWAEKGSNQPDLFWYFFETEIKNNIIPQQDTIAGIYQVVAQVKQRLDQEMETEGSA